ncbi:MAG: GAF domain-containing protein [Bdellovibrionales bacterium]|nr:GAF domain-containing protein [Bdellovibrionales bacterium]
MKLHRLLARQLQRHFPTETWVTALPPDFVAAINAAYLQADSDRTMIERSLELSSQELIEANRDLLKNNRDLSTIYRVAMLTLNANSLDEIGDQLLLEISQGTNFPIIALELLTDNRQSVRMAAAFGFENIAALRGRSFDLNQTPASEALLESKSIIRKGTGNTLPYTTDPWRQVAEGAIVSVPIFNENQVFGALTFAQKNPTLLNAETLKLMESLAAHLAVWLAQRRAEQQLQEQQVLMINSAKMSTLGLMAGSIAHEINNPVAIIHSLSDEMADILTDGSDVPRNELRLLAEKIKTTAFRISKIIAGLRTFSRDGTRDPLQYTSVKQILEEAASLCGEKFKNHGVRLEIEECPSNLTIECRATQILQILLNLLGNSFDAIEDTPDRWIRVSIQDLGGEIELRVIDSGHGISEKIEQKLFQPFFTTKTNGKGTGLGLSISLGIAKNHGGNLSVDRSSANTCFCLRLPKRYSVGAIEKHAEVA